MPNFIVASFSRSRPSWSGDGAHPSTSGGVTQSTPPHSSTAPSLVAAQDLETQMLGSLGTNHSGTLHPRWIVSTRLALPASPGATPRNERGSSSGRQFAATEKKSWPRSRRSMTHSTCFGTDPYRSTHALPADGRQDRRHPNRGALGLDHRRCARLRDQRCPGCPRVLGDTGRGLPKPRATCSSPRVSAHGATR